MIWPEQIHSRVFRVCARVVIYYAAFVVIVALLQRRIIYQPTQLPLDGAIRIAGQSGFQPWKNLAGEIIGWHLPALSKPAATVLVFHGNAGWAGERSYLAAPISAVGPADVYVVEYPGYGARGGSPAQAGILKVAEEAFALLADKSPLYLVSESLGAEPVSHLARLHDRQISGLLLFVPYNNFVALARRRMPFLPVSLMLRERCAPDQWLAGYTGPVGFVLAGNDEIIPVDLAQQLFDGFATGRKKLWRFSDAGHNDVASQTVEWWKSVFDFWRDDAVIRPSPLTR